MKRSREAGAETGRDPKADTAPVEYVIGLVSVVTGVPLSDIWATDRTDARTAPHRTDPRCVCCTGTTNQTYGSYAKPSKGTD